MDLCKHYTESCKFSVGQSSIKKLLDENAPIGSQALQIQVFPRERFSLEPHEGSSIDVSYFKHEEVGSKDIVIKVAKSLEDLVDQATPKVLLRFKLSCVGSNGTEIVEVPVEVKIRDVNDHVPEFVGIPYAIQIDELTPVGSVIFRGIKAPDGDQPKTDNSRVKYSITNGNIKDTFSFPDPSDGNVVLNRPLDYDEGTREFNLEIQAQDHGSPSLSTVTTLTIKVMDTDDQNPAFSQDLYQVRIREKATLRGVPIREKLNIVPKIEAYDKDRAINSSIRYSILSGNAKNLFDVDVEDGSLFVIQEIDREALDDTSFSLQIQAMQADNPLRQGLARVDIDVLDVNDNLPIFDTKLYNISILENAPNDFRVTQVHASDADISMRQWNALSTDSVILIGNSIFNDDDDEENADFKYRLEDASGAFRIDEVTGWVTVKDQNKLDREVNNKLVFRVYADEEVPNVLQDTKLGFTTVEVKLLDTNDNNPSFIPKSYYEFNVSELAEGGDHIGNVLALDPDLGDNGQVFYYLANDTFSGAVPFGVEIRNGSIYVLESYTTNYNKPLFYTMFIAAADRPEHSKERRHSLALVKINVIDVNNNPPELLELPYEADVGENLPAGTLVLQIKATDADVNNNLQYSLQSLNNTEHFQIDPTSGMITTAATLDFEDINEYTLMAEVSDGEHVSLVPVQIYVIDINDHVPQLSQSNYRFDVTEELQSDVLLGSVKAEDGDQGNNGEIEYKILDDRYNGTFTIDNQGDIIVTRRLDREKEPRFQFIVVAHDRGIPSLSSTATVDATVSDINDNQPKFKNDRLLVEIPEELKQPVFLLKVEATDPDDGVNSEIRFIITSGNEDGDFSINETTGDVYARHALDYEIKPTYAINITAQNIKPFEGDMKNRASLPSITQLIINVIDRHDSIPQFQEPFYEFSVPENSKPNVIAGKVNATNLHTPFKQKMAYWIPSNEINKIVTINRSSGEVILRKSMDFDLKTIERKIRFLVFARDEFSINNASSRVNVTINIEDVNDNKPSFSKETYQVLVPEDLPVNSTIPVELKVSDIDSGVNGQVSEYSILTTQDIFRINNVSGKINLVHPLDYEREQRYILQVAAMDSGNPPQTGSVVIMITVENINEFPPVFTNESYEFIAGKNFPIGGLVGQVKAEDGDGNAVQYNIIGGDVGFFRIVGRTGSIYSTAQISSRDEYTLKVVAIDDGHPTPQTSSTSVKIRAQPPNNHSPLFLKPIYDAIVKEKDASGKPVVRVSAKDDDLLYNEITYKILEGNAAGIFEINETTGIVTVNPKLAKLLDYDSQNIYPLAIQAKDNHEEPRMAITLAIIVVEDINDHPPGFTKREYETSIKENLERGKCFFKVQASSGDSVDRIQYRIINATGPFVIHSSSGQICTEDTLDRERIARYDLLVQALDGKYASFAKVTVLVEDENDNTPQFEKDVFSVLVPNDARAGTVLLRLHVFDPDDGNNGQVTFWATNMYGLYDVNSTTGDVLLLNDLNKTETDTLIYETEVYAQDHGSEPRLAKASLIIRITATGAHPPEFEKFVYEVVVPEQMAPLEVVTVQARSKDKRNTSSVRYDIAKIIGENIGDAFDIDPVTGRLLLMSPMNYDTNRFVQVIVEARDIERETLASETLVQLKIADVNNHPPKFYPFPKSIRVPLSAKLGEIVYLLKASDDDFITSGGSPNLTYELKNQESMFSVDSISGNLVVERRLLPLVKNLTVIVKDKGFPPLATEAQLTMEVYDEKDPKSPKYPKFSFPNYEMELPGPVTAGTQIYQIQAMNSAEETVIYGISSTTCKDVFSIQPRAGKLIVTRALTKSPCHIIINSHIEGAPQYSTEIVVTIKAKLFSTSCPHFNLKEYRAAILENTAVGEVVISDIQVEKPESYQQLFYQLISDNSDGHFYLETSKNIASLKIKKRVDREKMPFTYNGLFTLKAIAANGNCTDKATLKIRIDDVNDNIPAFPKSLYEVLVKENAPISTVIGKISAIDLDNVDSDHLIYAIAEGNSAGYFEINETTGTLTVQLSLDREVTPSFELLISATDSANNTGFTKVHVIVEDANDRAPKFINDTIILVLDEGSTSVNASFVLDAFDDDEGINMELQFRIIKGNDEGQFRMRTRKNKGVLTVTKLLDRELYSVEGAAVKELIVEVKDKGEPSLSSTATIFMLIEDINDMAPQFIQKVYKEVVYETSPMDLVVTRVSAIDKDSAELTTLLYSFDNDSNPPDLPFAISNTTGVVTVIKQLDFAEQNVYNITLLVTDGKFLSKGLLQVHVKEELEPQGRSTPNNHRYQFRVPENAANAKVGQIIQTVSKWKVNRAKDFSILDRDAAKIFSISSDGSIHTKKGLDREKREIYSFVVLQEEKKRPEHKETYEVQVVVEDVNDEAPTFSRSYQGTISENSLPGTKVKVEPNIEAIDKDSGVNSVVVYFLSGNDSHLFSIDEVRGLVFWKGANGSRLDRETKERYVLQVGAIDLENLTSSTNLTISVTDVNDNPPKFIHGDQLVEILETLPTGKKISRVTAIDLDAPGRNSDIIYTILGHSGAFRVNPITGEVILVSTLEPETFHAINISGIDGGGLASFTIITVKVLDVNNHRPQFANLLYKFAIAEGAYSSQSVTLGKITATDKDFGHNAVIKYTIVASDKEELPFALDLSTGMLNITGDLDRETQGAYRFIIQAEDQGSPNLNSTTEIAVEIRDVNDEAPRFIGSPYYAQVSENRDPGQWVTQVKAVDFDSNTTGNGQVLYKLGAGHANRFYIDSKDGNVWTLAVFDYESQDSYNISIIAHDAGEPVLSSTSMLYVRVIDTVDIVPDFAKSVFTLEVAENISPSTVIYQLDSGSDRFSYSVEDNEGDETFAVDNRTGEVILLKHLDTERKSHYKLVVMATDTDVPPNVDRTTINIIVSTGQGLRMFPRRHYDITFMENMPAPALVFDFNASDETSNKMVEYSFVNGNYGDLFIIEPSTGKLMATKMLDRENVAVYHIRIKAEKVNRGRRRRETFKDGSIKLDASFVPSNEVLLTINVGDENDNAPLFSTKGKPLIVAAPVEANFGYEILTITAKDADAGLNGAVRYEIVHRDDDDSKKFYVDPVTGVIRSLMPLIFDGNGVFGFDVRATDMEGSLNGRSTYESIIVHVLPDTKMAVMILRSGPLTVEKSLSRLTEQLSNITGYHVKVCKISAHSDDAIIDDNKTDMFLFGIHPVTNNVIEVDTLLRALKENLDIIQEKLKALNVIKIHEVVFKQKSNTLSVSEIALLAFGCIIFVSAVIGFAAVCRRQQRKRNSSKITPGSFWEDHHKLYGLKSPLVNRTPGSSFADNSIDTQRNSCSCIIHSRPGSAGDGESQSYKDSLSSTSTLDLEKSRRTRQRAPSGSGHQLPPPPPDSPHPTKTRYENTSHAGWTREPIADLDMAMPRFDHS